MNIIQRANAIETVRVAFYGKAYTDKQPEYDPNSLYGQVATCKSSVEGDNVESDELFTHANNGFMPIFKHESLENITKQQATHAASAASTYIKHLVDAQVITIIEHILYNCSWSGDFLAEAILADYNNKNQKSYMVPQDNEWWSDSDFKEAKKIRDDAFKVILDSLINENCTDFIDSCSKYGSNNSAFPAITLSHIPSQLQRAKHIKNNKAHFINVLQEFADAFEVDLEVRRHIESINARMNSLIELVEFVGQKLFEQHREFLDQLFNSPLETVEQLFYEESANNNTKNMFITEQLAPFTKHDESVKECLARMISDAKHNGYSTLGGLVTSGEAYRHKTLDVELGYIADILKYELNGGEIEGGLLRSCFDCLQLLATNSPTKTRATLIELLADGTNKPTNETNNQLIDQLATKVGLTQKEDATPDFMGVTIEPDQLLIVISSVKAAHRFK